MAHRYRSISIVRTLAPTDAGLWVCEIVMLIDVEFLVVPSVAFFIELVVNAACLIAYVAILHIGKDSPLLTELIGSLQIDIAVELGSIGVVVLVVAIVEECLANNLVTGVREIAEVITLEILY